MITVLVWPAIISNSPLQDHTCKGEAGRQSKQSSFWRGLSPSLQPVPSEADEMEPLQFSFPRRYGAVICEPLSEELYKDLPSAPGGGGGGLPGGTTWPGPPVRDMLQHSPARYRC